MTLRAHLARLYRVTFRPHRRAYLDHQAIVENHCSDFVRNIWRGREIAQDVAQPNRAWDYEMRSLNEHPISSHHGRHVAIRKGLGLTYILRGLPKHKLCDQLTNLNLFIA